MLVYKLYYNNILHFLKDSFITSKFDGQQVFIYICFTQIFVLQIVFNPNDEEYITNYVQNDCQLLLKDYILFARICQLGKPSQKKRAKLGTFAKPRLTPPPPQKFRTPYFFDSLF